MRAALLSLLLLTSCANPAHAKDCLIRTPWRFSEGHPGPYVGPGAPPVFYFGKFKVGYDDGLGMVAHHLDRSRETQSAICQPNPKRAA